MTSTPSPLPHAVGSPVAVDPHLTIESSHAAGVTDTQAHAVAADALRIASTATSIPDSSHLTIRSLNQPKSADIPADAELSIGQGDLPEEQIVLQHGRDIIACKNNYVDPLSGNVFTMNYGAQVSEKDWENCTRCVIGAVWEQIDAFVMQQAEHGAAFKEGLKEVRGYTFDWRSGLIHLHMNGGTSYHIACGDTLYQEIKPYLSERTLKDVLPSPEKLTAGLRGISPALPAKTEAFLLYLATDPYTQKRLEEALEKLRACDKKNADIPRYQVLLETLRALKTGAQITLGEDERKHLEKALQPSFNLKQVIFSPKVGAEGDSWMREAIDSFQTRLNLHAHTPATHTCTLLLSTGDTGAKALDLGQNAALKAELALRPTASHFQIDVHGAATPLGKELAAIPNRSYLHLEPRTNLGTSDDPKWAEVTQVTCLVSKEGTKQNEAEYVHFAKHGQKWWHIDGDKCKEVKWSAVQQVAGLHASRIGFNIDVAPQAHLVRTRDAKSSASLPAATPVAATPAKATILDYGSVTIPNMNPAPWADEHQDALATLREHQASLFADDTTRTSVQSQLYFPALAPLIAAHPDYIESNNTFSPAARVQFKHVLESLATEDHPHVPTKSLCHYEIQEMATASNRPIVIITGTRAEDRLYFRPEDATAPTLPPLFFAAFSLSATDPTARATLTPLVHDSEAHRDEDVAALEGNLDKFLQKQAPMSPAGSVHDPMNPPATLQTS